MKEKLGTPPEMTRKEKIDEAVRQWLLSEMHGKPISQNTECWNNLYETLPSLVQRILAALKED